MIDGNLAVASASRLYRALNVAALLSAAALAAVVFYVDTFTEIQSTIAVVYGLSILMAGEFLNRIGTLIASTVCCLLTILSFVLAHWAKSDPATLLRLVVPLSAIVMTTAVLIRHTHSKERLVRSNVDLQKSERRYRAIFHQTRVALWEQDFSKLQRLLADLKTSGAGDIKRHAVLNPHFLEHCISLVETVSINDAALELLGKRPNDEIQGPIKRYILPEDECLADLIQCLYDGRTRFEGKMKLRRVGGDAVSVLVGISFPQDETGFERIVVGMFDVTQRDLTQQARLLAQSEMAKASRLATVGALSASIAHELNQPIGAVVLNAQSVLRWLRRETPDILSATEAADRIVRDAHRAAEILKRTREIVMRNPPEAEALDLVELIGETCVLLEHELTEESIVLQTKMPVRLPPVRIAKAEFQQVLVNLLNNGIQAIASVGGSQRKIVIECNPDGSKALRLTVRDYGPGIKEDQMARLFDPFFTTKTSGMGIGLAICRSIIESHGGKLIAKNHEGGGAVFDVYLPIEVNHD